jgi:hypothetical protein
MEADFVQGSKDEMNKAPQFEFVLLANQLVELIPLARRARMALYTCTQRTWRGWTPIDRNLLC